MLLLFVQFTFPNIPELQGETEQTYSQIMMELNSAKSQLQQLYDLVRNRFLKSVLYHCKVGTNKKNI